MNISKCIIYSLLLKTDLLVNEFWKKTPTCCEKNILGKKVKVYPFFQSKSYTKPNVQRQSLYR